MADRKFQEPHCYVTEQTHLTGSFAPQGTSAPATVRGIGYSVARTSVGLYTITMEDPFNEFLSGDATVQGADGQTYKAQFGDYDSSAKTIQLRVTGAVPGYLPLDITGLREIATNDIQNLAAHGGIMASDSTPLLQRVNAATDKALRVVWAAGNVNEAQFAPVTMPPNLDASSDVTVHLLALMSGATDTPTIDVQVFDGIGDTEMGGATGALSSSLQELTVTIGNADITGHPLGFFNIALVPGTHATDAVHLHGAWLEYTRSELVDLAADDNNRVLFDLVFKNSSVKP